MDSFDSVTVLKKENIFKTCRYCKEKIKFSSSIAYLVFVVVDADVDVDVVVDLGG